MINMKKETGKKNEVATLDLNNVPGIISALDDKLKSLSHVTDSKYRTTGKLDGIGDIKEMTKIEDLIKAYSVIVAKEKAYNEAALDLDINTFKEFTVFGHTKNDWKLDIKLRIDLINHKDTLEQLKMYKSKFEKFLSEEDQKSMLINELASFLATK